MEDIKVYDKTATICKGTVTKLEYNGSWMEGCHVSTDIESPVPVDFAVGDYIEYRKERFEIINDPAVKMQSMPKTYGGAYIYEGLTFYSLIEELSDCDFLDYTLAENHLHYSGLPTYSFYAASVKDLADRLQANLDRYSKQNNTPKWEIEVHPEYADKTDVNVSVDKISCRDALALAENDFGAHYIVRGRKITIGTAGLPADHLFKMGKDADGNLLGLYEIEKQADSEQKITTRLRAYGTETNMPHRYYNSLSDADGKKFVPDNMAVGCLMLPDFPEKSLDPYIDSLNVEKIGVKESSISFDGSNGRPDIHPSIEESTAEDLVAAGIATASTGRLDEIIDAQKMKDDGVGTIVGSDIIPETETFTITVKDWGFDINEHWADETPQISFKSGMLGGRDFEIRKDGNNKPKRNADKTWTLTLNRIYDESLKLWFPYKDYNAAPNDRFVVLHIKMPEVYIKTASQRLLRAAKEWLAKNDYTRYIYSPKIDEIFMATQHRIAVNTPGMTSLHDTIKEGDLLVFEEETLGIGGKDGGASVFIDKLVIKEGEGPVPTYEVTLREEKSVGTIERIQNQIDSIKGSQGNGNGGYTATQIRNLISLFGRQFFLSKIAADTAKGRITFEQGSHFGYFVSGFVNGRGAGIDAAGNAEVESIVVRSYMKIFELIYNRLNAQEGEFSFADVGTIEKLADNGNGTLTATMRKRWDGDFTAFQPGDIVYGYVNNLDNATAKEYGKAWARVTAVDRAANTLTLVPYKDSDVPSGHNLAVTEEMIISRWGNNIVPSAEAHANPDYASFIVQKNGQWINTRQQSFFVSCEQGDIVELMGVDSPKLREGNYGMTLGQIPEGLLDEETMKLINPGQPYLYARGIVVQDLIRIGYKGVTIRTPNFRGEWDADTAASADGYYRMADDMADVTACDGALWQCAVPHAGTEPPSDTNPDWIRLTARPQSEWRIVPNVNTVYIRKDKKSTELLKCVVRHYTSDGSIDIETPEELDKHGVKLMFSLDGKTYKEFWVRSGDTIDGIDLDGGDIIAIGGNNVPWVEILDNIHLYVTDAKSGDAIEAYTVPVVKDGEDGGEGTPGKDGGKTENRYMVIDGYDLPDGYVFDGTVRNPSGWSLTYGEVLLGQSLWAISAEIDGEGRLIGVWNPPVRLTGEPGKDGNDGNPGKTGLLAYPAGAFDPLITYKATETATPVVMDGKDGQGLGQYYVLGFGKTYCSKDPDIKYKTPHEDAVNNGGYWTRMDRFSSIFADIIMAEFAKLGSAVFSGDLMFSQQGLLNGNYSEDYQKIANTTNPFEPNILLDFKTGKAVFRNVEVYGYVRQKMTRITESNWTRYAAEPVDEDARMLDWRKTGGSIWVEDIADFLQVSLPDLRYLTDSTEISNARTYAGVTAVIYNASSKSFGVSACKLIERKLTGTQDGHRYSHTVRETSRSSFTLAPGQGVEFRCSLGAEHHYIIGSDGYPEKVYDNGNAEELIWEMGDVFAIKK